MHECSGEKQDCNAFAFLCLEPLYTTCHTRIPRARKRKRVQVERPLIVEEGARLATLQEFRARNNSKKAKKQVRAKVGKQS